MGDRVSAFDRTALGVNRRAMRSFANYVFVVWYAFSAWVGELGLALIGIFCIELVNTFWRYMPRQAPGMPDPTPSAWRAPMRVLRLSAIVWHIGALASSAFGITIVLVIVAVIARPSHLGTANLVVVIALGVWLVTRPIWFPHFAQAMLSLWRQLPTDSRPRGGARLSITADGIDLAVPPQVQISSSVRPSWSWHFAFSEIDELRTLSETESASYMVGTLEYDPTIAVRANVDLARYAKGDIQRPAIFLGGTGPVLLLRGKDFLFSAGVADGSGPGAVTAWQAWGAAHPAAQESSAGNLQG